jgi:hypothetical protein
MEWLGMLIWALLVLLAFPLALLGSLVSPSLGLQSLLVVGGLVFCGLYIALDGAPWLAWASVGLALAGALAVAAGAARLVSDVRGPITVGQAKEEHAATLAGAELPLLLTVAFVMVLAAVGVTTIS